MDQFRVALAAAVTVSLLSALIEIFVYDSYVVVLVLTAWMLRGYMRVFGRSPVAAPSYPGAIKAVLMALAWPLVPKRR
jgi:hypothetical protein